MADQKAMTLRFGLDIAGDLSMIAAVDERPVSEIVREAVADYISHRRQDPDFQVALIAHIARAQHMIDAPGTGEEANRGA